VPITRALEAKHLVSLPLPFLSFAADILANTSRGLSGNEVVKAFNAYAVEYNINIPHAAYLFDGRMADEL
jgi:hypothetical protein